MPGHKRKHFKGMDDDLDLVPLIDVVFLILLFFILCGRLTVDPAYRADHRPADPDRRQVRHQGLGADRPQRLWQHPERQTAAQYHRHAAECALGDRRSR